MASWLIFFFIEQPDGSIDSIALGGSFATAKAFIQDQKAEADRVSVA
tara:strand:+ start:409 stop:549 length:141 start_codon:yes stop_codon:yes gene_type:complete